MAEDAEIETAAVMETPVEAAPAVATAEPSPEVVAEAAPLKSTPVDAAPAEPAHKPRVTAATAPARKTFKARAARAVKAKAPRSTIPAASPAPQAAAAPNAARKAAPRKTVKTRQAPQIGPGKPTLLPFKETIMATPFDLTQIQTAFADLQGKAKAAMEKSTAALGEANDFAKGNVEAVVESGKLLSAGLQDLGATLVAETRSAFEGLTADAKELAAAKSPTEFFQLQTTLVRKQFDGAVAQASKNTEAWLKLANEAFAPLSSRMTLAVEKVSKAA